LRGRVPRPGLDHDRRSPPTIFGGQEPGGATEITEAAQHQYGVTFLIAAKAVVKGPDVHPFFSWGRKPRQALFRGWNFHKYLIGRDGYIAEAFASTVEPTDARIKPRLAGRFRKAEAARKRQVSPQLTGPAGKSPRRIKAVAVAAQLLLG